MISKISNKKGQSLVELAVILPLIVMIIAFIVSAGQMFNAKALCQQAAYQAARTYVVSGNRTEAKKAGNEILKNVIGQMTPTSITEPINIQGSPSYGQIITVTASVELRTLFSFESIGGGPKKPVTATASLMYERR